MKVQCEGDRNKDWLEAIEQSNACLERIKTPCLSLQSWK